MLFAAAAELRERGEKKGEKALLCCIGVDRNQFRETSLDSTWRRSATDVSHRRAQNREAECTHGGKGERRDKKRNGSSSTLSPCSS